MFHKVIKYIRTISRRSFVLSNIIISILSLFSWVGSHSWYNLPWLSLLALLFPALCFLLLIFLLFWLLFARSKRHALISLIPLLICSCLFGRYWQFNDSTKIMPPETLKIMTYNCKNFNPYKEQYQEADRYISYSQNLEMLKEHTPDILCLQEYDSILKADLLKLYPYYSINQRLNDKCYKQVAIFSKFPILNTYALHHMKGLYTNNMVADIQLKDQIIRVYNIHLESLTLNKNLINQLQKAEANYQDGTQEVYNRFTTGFSLHNNQINVIAKDLQKSPHPIVLCGDFNNTPFSYEYDKITHYLQDTYRLKGNDIPNTYHNIPLFLRIDYIFTSPKIILYRHQIIRNRISDHYPVMIWFNLL